MTVSALVVSIILGTVLPIVVGIVTKINAPSKLKGALLTALNALQAWIVSAVALDGSAVFTKDSALLFALGMVTSLATYYGVYKPNDVPLKLAPGFGIGPKS